MEATTTPHPATAWGMQSRQASLSQELAVVQQRAHEREVQLGAAEARLRTLEANLAASRAEAKEQVGGRPTLPDSRRRFTQLCSPSRLD